MALVNLLASNAQAAVIFLQPVVSAYYDATTYDPLPAEIYYGFPVLVQVDVMMQVLSLAAGEDSFGGAVFSFDLYSIALDPDQSWWYPNDVRIDVNGPGIGGGGFPIFSTNADLGPDNNDLKSITVQLASGPFINAFDPRRNVGEPGSPLGVPFKLGSTYLLWSGTGRALIQLSPVHVQAKLKTGEFVPALGLIYQTEVGSMPIPEPSSAALLGCCLMGVALRRRVG